MTIQAIIERLKNSADTPLRLTDGIGALASLGTEGPKVTPAAYVYLRGQAASANDGLAGRVRQVVECDVIVLVITRNVRDAGALAALEVGGIAEWVRRKLVGWMPPGANGPITLVSGEVVRARGGEVWWEETLAVSADWETS